MNPKLKRIEEDLTQGHPKSVYVLLGDDDWGKQRFRTHARKHLLESGQEAFNLTQLDAGEVSGVEVVDAAGVVPMLGSRRLILVSDCGTWRKSDWQAVMGYVARPNASTCLILDWGSHKGKPSLGKPASELVCVSFDRPKTWKLTDTIRHMASEHHLTLRAEAAELIAELSGDDLGKVDQELGKLSIFKLDGVVTGDDVAALMGRTRPVICWELNRFLGRRDLSGALKKMHDILDSGEPLFALLATIARTIKQLFESKALIIEGIRDPSQIASAMGVPRPAAQELAQDQHNFSGVELRLAMRAIRDTDVAMRTLLMDRRLLLDRLIARIVAPSAWSPPHVNPWPAARS